MNTFARLAVAAGIAVGRTHPAFAATVRAAASLAADDMRASVAEIGRLQPTEAVRIRGIIAFMNAGTPNTPAPVARS